MKNIYNIVAILTQQREEISWKIPIYMIHELSLWVKSVKQVIQM